jgi:triacylglycerol lipase
MAALFTFLVVVIGVVAVAAVLHAATGSRRSAGQPAAKSAGAGRASLGTGVPGPGAGAPGLGAAVPRTSVPGPGPRVAFAPQDRPGPVLLVPGYGGSAIDLSGLADRINAAGRTAMVVNLPGNGTGDLRADARVLNSAVSRALRHGAPSVDVIGYSAGGVVALIWALHDDGAAKARRVIAIGAPFHGTAVAAAAQAFTPSLCAAACRQLVPGSRLLASLDADPAPRGPGWLSLWSTDDLVITPPASARLAGALNVPIQSLCPGRQINHLQLPADPVVAAIVLRAIGRAPLRYPTAASCHA